MGVLDWIRETRESLITPIENEPNKGTLGGRVVPKYTKVTLEERMKIADDLKLQRDKLRLEELKAKLAKQNSPLETKLAEVKRARNAHNENKGMGSEYAKAKMEGVKWICAGFFTGNAIGQLIMPPTTPIAQCIAVGCGFAAVGTGIGWLVTGDDSKEIIKTEFREWMNSSSDK